MGTLQHSGLRLPASGHLPGRAAGPRHQRRPPAPLCRAQRDALHGRLAYAHARPAPRKTRGHHAAAHHPRPVRLFRLRHGELLQQEAGKLPAPKGRRRQPCSAGNRARVRPPVQPAVPDQPRRTQGRERRTDAGMRRGPALHRRRCRDRHAGTGRLHGCREQNQTDAPSGRGHSGRSLLPVQHAVRGRRLHPVPPDAPLQRLALYVLHGSAGHHPVRLFSRSHGPVRRRQAPALPHCRDPQTRSRRFSKTPASPQSCRKIPRNAPSTSCWWIWAATTSGA